MESPTTSSSSDHHHWTRGRCIGRGSFATVHIATTNTTNHTFAVKSTPLLSPNSTQLNNEIQILIQLHNHNSPPPYIIQYLGHDETTNYRNLHLEYLPNGTVSEQSIIVKTEHLVRSYTRCLVAALAHLHSLNIVHCDVKGRNVLVGHKYGECKLADFGSAFEISISSSTSTAAAAIVTRGSPLWMAPEVMRGEFQGPESDVWSLGCTVIEMLTGNVNRGGGDTVWQVAFSDKTPEIPAWVSAEGGDFLDKCLRRERKERWRCEDLMKHPFVAAEVGIESLTWSNTPRCVLDEFDEKFDGFDEMGSDLDSMSGSETASLCNSWAIEKLCCGGGGGFEWGDDDEGWMTVRRTRMTEYSDSVTESRGENVRMNWNLGPGFCWAGGVGLVCGYELKDVSGFGGVLLGILLSFLMSLWLMTSLFNNYWRLLKRLVNSGDLLLVCLFLVFGSTKR